MIFVTGATGFIGRHTVQALLDKGHKVTAIIRDVEKLKTMPWADKVDYIVCDLYEDFTPVVGRIHECKTLVHLAWQGLPNFKDTFHLTENLPCEIEFLTAMIEGGLKHLLVTGTCYEYGMQYGPLSIDMDTKPVTAYGLAKDCLRKALEKITAQHGALFQWVRLFFMYGEGQNPKSLIPLLEAAIARGDTEFPMSGGEQLRDYMKAEDLAAFLARVMSDGDRSGLINCCTGAPISVRRLVEEIAGGRIALKLGVYPYPDYEPLGFWGGI